MRKAALWLKAFRLRTLPLAFSCAITGTFLAASNGAFRMSVLALTLLTTLLLQVLSNLANDYGDALSGADNSRRVGPQRVTHTGMVSHKEMKNMIIAFAIASFLSGVALVIVGLYGALPRQKVLFLVFGVLAIVAALRYTLGPKPYGYRGLGDIYVFLFFGLLGVLGSCFMQMQSVNITLLLPAASIGFFSTGVLNLNNLRDENSDRETGKRTIVVMKVSAFGKKYHIFLIFAGIVTALIYSLLYFESYLTLLWLLIVPFFIAGVIRVRRASEPKVENSLYNFTYPDIEQFK